VTKKLLLKENEEEARERLRAFWAGSSLGRPVVLATVRGKEIAPLPGESERFPVAKANEWDPRFTEEATDWWLTHTTDVWLGESMPRACFGPGSSLVLPAVWVGADYELDGGTAWIKPIDGLYERPLPVFDPRAPSIHATEECMMAMVRAVKGRAFVNPPLLMDGLTTLSMLRTPEQLCLDLLERPDDVRRWSDALTSLFVEGYDYFYNILLRHGHGEAGAFFILMAEGRMEAVECDFAVMMSPKQFERFALPDLLRMTNYLEYSLYHLDGTCQMRFLDLLRTLPKLTGIQWNPEPPAGSPLKWIGAFKEIRKRSFCLTVSCGTVDEAVGVTRELGPDGLALFLPSFDTRGEAERAIERIEKAV